MKLLILLSPALLACSVQAALTWSTTVEFVTASPPTPSVSPTTTSTVFLTTTIKSLSSSPALYYTSAAPTGNYAEPSNSTNAQVSAYLSSWKANEEQKKAECLAENTTATVVLGPWNMTEIYEVNIRDSRNATSCFYVFADVRFNTTEVISFCNGTSVNSTSFNNTASNTTSSNGTSIAPIPPPGHHGLSPGAKAGVGVGSTIGGILISYGGWHIFVRHHPFLEEAERATLQSLEQDAYWRFLKTLEKFPRAEDFIEGDALKEGWKYANDMMKKAFNQWYEASGKVMRANVRSSSSMFSRVRNQPMSNWLVRDAEELQLGVRDSIYRMVSNYFQMQHEWIAQGASSDVLRLNSREAFSRMRPILDRFEEEFFYKELAHPGQGWDLATWERIQDDAFTTIQKTQELGPARRPPPRPQQVSPESTETTETTDTTDTTESSDGSGPPESSQPESSESSQFYDETPPEMDGRPESSESSQFYDETPPAEEVPDRSVWDPNELPDPPDPECPEYQYQARIEEISNRFGLPGPSLPLESLPAVPSPPGTPAPTRLPPTEPLPTPTGWSPKTGTNP